MSNVVKRYRRHGMPIEIEGFFCYSKNGSFLKSFHFAAKRRNMNTLHEFVAEPMIAYFSMEIGIRNDIPTYSGGLGILAGDTIKSAADLKLPVVAVTLISRKGYFSQEIDASGWQKEQPTIWDPAKYMTPLP